MYVVQHVRCDKSSALNYTTDFPIEHVFQLKQNVHMLHYIQISTHIHNGTHVNSTQLMLFIYHLY